MSPCQRKARQRSRVAANSSASTRPRTRAWCRLHPEDSPEHAAVGSQAIANTSSSRPQTRAFVRQHNQGNALQLTTISKPQPRPARRNKRPIREAAAFRKRRSLTIGLSSKPLTATEVAHSQDKRTAVPVSRGRQARASDEERKQYPSEGPAHPATEVGSPNNSKPLNASVSVWLSSITTQPPTAVIGSFSTRSIARTIPPSMAAVIDSSSSLTTATTSNTGEDDQTTEKASSRRHTKGPKVSYKEKLFKRAVSVKPSHDSKLEEINLKNDIYKAVHVISWETLNPFMEMLRNFLEAGASVPENRRKRNAFDAWDAFMDRIRDWAPEDGHSSAMLPMSTRQFDTDREFCMSTNEAVLQRTTMMSIINRYEFKDMFSFNCEGQWDIEDRYRLQATGEDEKLTLPKPDLAISFDAGAIRGTKFMAPTPIKLTRCLSPDGECERWFPFLFIEVKRATDTLQNALYANLHSAAQALYNIYHWMCGSEDLLQKFYDDIRVFSITLNAQEITLRIHRAELNEDDCMVYHFDVVVRIDTYNRRQACHMVTCVLNFAKKHLHEVLRDAWSRLSEKIQQKAQTKRQPQSVGVGRAPKRPRSDRETTTGSKESVADAAKVPDNSQSSFNASRLTLDDD